MSLPYNPPVRLQSFNRRYIVRDASNREVFEFTVTSYDIGYTKRMEELTRLVVDLMNGAKTIEYDNDSKSFNVLVHDNVPEAPKGFVIPGLKKLAAGIPLDDGYREPKEELSGAAAVAVERGVKPEGFEVQTGKVPEVPAVKKRGRQKGWRKQK